MADQLLEAYHGLDEKWRGASRGRFVEMIVMVGCFLLVLMSENGRQEDYAPNDPIFSAHGNHVFWKKPNRLKPVEQMRIHCLILEPFSCRHLKLHFYTPGGPQLESLIADSFPTTRSVEDLKSRYYSA
ncbi:hypothetical protein SEVIR_7G286466v4 [Setaria viridis]